MRRSVFLVLLLCALVVLPSQVTTSASPSPFAMSCTFTANRPTVNLRSGPGTEYERVGTLKSGETLAVVDQGVGKDTYVWWKSSANTWVRSDLGTSDCPATCGNTVCEYGETSASCAKDCSGTKSTASTTTTSTATTTTGTGCVFASCEACIAAFPCTGGVACTHTTCNLNAYGCPVCTTAP